MILDVTGHTNVNTLVKPNQRGLVNEGDVSKPIP